MLNLVLIRHGKSSWKYQDLEDYERPLNDRGRSDIPLMAERIALNFPAPSRILSSSAERAMQTARGLLDSGKFSDAELISVDDLYLAEPEEIMLVLRSRSAGETIYLVGHNPGISLFASRLCGRDLGDLPTFASVYIQIDEPVQRSGGWEHVAWGEGELQQVLTPKNP
jgi:phosphohistidine phosphatase